MAGDLEKQRVFSTWAMRDAIRSEPVVTDSPAFWGKYRRKTDPKSRTGVVAGFHIGRAANDRGPALIRSGLGASKNYPRFGEVGETSRTMSVSPSPRPSEQLCIRPNALWVVDFTYVHIWAGFVYVPFVIDAFARRIVGWKVRTSATAGFLPDALEQANVRRSTVPKRRSTAASCAGRSAGNGRTSSARWPWPEGSNVIRFD